MNYLFTLLSLKASQQAVFQPCVHLCKPSTKKTGLMNYLIQRLAQVIKFRNLFHGDLYSLFYFTRTMQFCVRSVWALQWFVSYRFIKHDE